MQREQTFDGEFPDDWDSDPRECDPAVFVAKLMVKNAIAAQPIIESGMMVQASIIIVKTSMEEWTELICLAWLAHFFPDAVFTESVRRWRQTSKFFAVSCNVRNVQFFDPSDIKAHAEKTWRGIQLLIFSADPEHDISAEVLRFCDYFFEVPACKSADIQLLLKSITEEASGWTISPESVAAITPKLLRLARRPHQSAEDYGLRLVGRAESLAAKFFKPTSPRGAPDLKRIHGLDEAVAWGLRLADDIADFKAGKLKWSDVDHGCLLSGPPGVGKTLFARALSETCAVPLIVGSYSIWHSSGGGHQGAFLKAMRGAFFDAKKQAPVILFIDEIDSFPNRATLRHNWADYEIQIVNALLAELDGTDGREGVVVIGACNLPEKLDPALIRSGRLDRHIRVELPNPAALGKILREHLGPDLLGADLVTVALAAAGSSGADCEKYVRGARRTARLARRPMVLGDLIEEIGGQDPRSEAELLRAAIHEAGHAYGFATLLPGRLEAVSIRAVGSLGGATASKTPKTPVTAAEARAHLVTLLCGRAAEQVFFGDPSSGAGGNVQSDLGIATRWATAAAASLGFSEKLGLAWRGDPDQGNLSQILSAYPSLAEVVQSDLQVSYEAALQLITLAKNDVLSLAKALVEHRALSSHQVGIILGKATSR